MSRHNYPASAWHKGQHDNRAQEDEGIRTAHRGANGEAAPLLLEFLSGWLRDHIRLADCMMAATCATTSGRKASGVVTMPRTWGIALGAPLCLMFLACSPPNQARRRRRPPPKTSGFRTCSR